MEDEGPRTVGRDATGIPYTRMVALTSCRHAWHADDNEVRKDGEGMEKAWMDG